jgi:hypothetical protein
MRLAIPILAVGLMALGGTSAIAAPATTSTATSDIPLSGTVVNPCNGESVSWQGTAHFVTHQTVTSDGHNTLSGEVNFKGVEGQGSLGNVYRDVNTVSFQLNRSGDGAPDEVTTAAAFLFVSEGSAPNFEAYTTYHVTIDANGQPTATVVRIGTACRG